MYIYTCIYIYIYIHTYIKHIYIYITCYNILQHNIIYEYTYNTERSVRAALELRACAAVVTPRPKLSALGPGIASRQCDLGKGE